MSINRDKTKEDIKNEEYAKKDSYFAMVNDQTLEEYKTALNHITTQLETPVSNNNISATYKIGNWKQTYFPTTKDVLKSDNLERLPTDEEINALIHSMGNEAFSNILLPTDNSTIQEYPKAPSKTLSHAQIKKEFVDQYERHIGYFDHSPYITMIFKNNPTQKQDLNSEDIASWYPIMLHEKVHYDHWFYSGQGQSQQTAGNAAKSDRLTETIANSVEFLSLANLYTTMKNKNLKTYEINGTQVPIEHLLENYPKLKETVLKYGFDAQSPESIRRIVKISAEYWHGQREQQYHKQHLSSAKWGSDTFSCKTWSQKIKALKNEESDYKQTSARMLKNIDIGQNTAIDLTHCQDLLDTMTTTEAHHIINEQDEHPMTYKEIKEIDKYLTQKGLLTDEEKTNYMAKTLSAIAQRNQENIDQDLANIISKYNSTIRYSDGLEVQKMKDNSLFIATKDDKFYTIHNNNASPKNKTNSATKQNNTILSVSHTR